MKKFKKLGYVLSILKYIRKKNFSAVRAKGANKD